VTHAQSEALVLADRIVVMNRGNVEQISKPFDLYTRPKTPFVARFIGKNTILDGTLSDSKEAFGVVTTEFGALRGQVNDATLKPGDAASIVIPSEAIDVFPAQVGDAGERAKYAGNEIAGTVLASDVVAHTIYLALRLANGRELSVESHVRKYARALTEGRGAVTICWLPEAATIIRQGE